MADADAGRFARSNLFLSTFVMIGQNRQAAFQQTKADHDYSTVNQLLVENTELTRDIDA